MSLETIIKLGYSLVIITIFLMIWASLSSAKDIIIHKYPPCSFNVLCSCSKIAPDLGTVQCHNVPFSRIPPAINVSKVYTLSMENTGLLDIEPYFLQATGLYQLKITNNKLNDLPDDAFFGLERSLRELFLYENHLTEIPTRSLRNLQNLKILDLHSNEINTFDKYSWFGYGNSLKSLNLAKNSISMIPKDGFNDLPMLDVLDLSGNNIVEIDPNVFNDGLGKISKFLLADNLLTYIPYLALSKLSFLRYLDLSFNRIKEVTPNSVNITVKLSLDVLHLEYNFINDLETNSFNNFNIVNSTILNGNRIQIMEKSAFRNAKIREIYLKSCGLQFIDKDTFDGLENTLQILDLSNNNITAIPDDLLRNFSMLSALNIDGNNAIKQYPPEVIIGIGQTLQHLEIKSEALGLKNLQSFKVFRNLRHLSISDIHSNTISTDDFLNYNANIEELKLKRSSIQKINAHTFTHVRGINELDLSENKITNIDKDAFAEIGYSFISLILSHGLSTQMSSLPYESLQYLTLLQKLDLSNNKLKNVAENSFHFLRNLKYLILNDNQIDEIQRGTFQGEIHKKIEEIILSFNNLKLIKSFTFADLDVIENIQIDDNRIVKIERQAFSNLNELHTLNLRGNKIIDIDYEAFQNLPKLDILDISYNSLQNFELSYLDQVGSLASLYVNLSHNRINELTNKNRTQDNIYNFDTNLYLNIKVFDLNNNNISNIQRNFFKPVELSLTHLYLANNQLKNTSKEIFGNLVHLQWLDLSHNLIREISSNSFRKTKKIQILDLSHNKINDITSDLLQSMKELRIIDLSHNHIRFVPDSLFTSEGMEYFDISNNDLTKVPSSSFSNLAALSLSSLNLSHNNIGAINSVDFSKFRSLSNLDLSFNRIIRLEDAVFATLFHLSYLDLSHNNEIDVTGKSFVGLENNLIELRLSNLSLKTFPELSLPHLRTLTLAYNNISTVSYDLAKNVSSIKYLDLSYNNFSTAPLIIHSLPLLKSLSIAGNSLRTITNDTLLVQTNILEELDISLLRLSEFEVGALDKMNNMKKLKISSYSNLKNFNIPQIVKHLNNLRSLWIYEPTTFNTANSSSKIQQNIDIKTDLRFEMDGLLPEKLNEIVIIGNGFHSIADNILIGIQSPKIHFSLINTSLTKFPENIFRNAFNLRNISLNLVNNNRALKNIPNPIFTQNSEKLSLINFEISGASLKCDCDIGWIEYWSRQKRQYVCPQYMNGASKYSEICKYTNDLREAKCENKKNENLIEILKSEIECGWGNRGKREQYAGPLIILGLIIIMWI